jgi:hypothetical protein
MKLDESSPVEHKNAERTAKRWAHRSHRNASCRGPEPTTRSFDRRRAGGCVFEAGCGNQIVPRLHIGNRAMLSVRWNRMPPGSCFYLAVIQISSVERVVLEST